MATAETPESKLATNIDAQFAWLAGEMDYSRRKAPYEEKRERLSRDPEDPQSVFAFMNSYWSRFRTFNNALHENVSQDLATKALQYHAKVVAGICDKVALSFWLEARGQGTPEDQIDQEVIVSDSLVLVRAALAESPYHISQLLPMFDAPFEANPMGQAILRLHEAYHSNPTDTETLRALALGGAAGGVQML